MSLASFRGKYVMLAPFLTLCQEECPLTTGVFQELQASVDKAGLGDMVAFVEVTVDPGRDTPAPVIGLRAPFWRRLDAAHRDECQRQGLLETARGVVPKGARRKTG